VILRIGTGVDCRGAQFLPAPELTAAEELSLQALVPGIARIQLVHVVVHTGVEDRDHDTGAVDAQLLPDAGEQRVVLGLAESARVARAHHARSVVIVGVVDRHRLDAGDARERLDQLHLGERRVGLDVVDRQERPRHRHAGGEQGSLVRRRGMVVIADVDRELRAEGVLHPDDHLLAYVAVHERCAPALLMDALDRVVDLVGVGIPPGERRRRLQRQQQQGRENGSDRPTPYRSNREHVAPPRVPIHLESNDSRDSGTREACERAIDWGLTM
jgi:hypothetical protein